jgi:murein DD-endopeptidase MepM/ murein hydrolase activator NlpD
MRDARLRAEARLVGLYKTHRGSAVGYLFSATSPMDFARRYRNARFVVAGDVRAIENYRARLETLNGKIAALLDSQRALRRVVGEVQAKRSDADDARRRHRAALDTIRRDQRLYILQAEELERASGVLQDRIDRLGVGSFKPLDFAGLRGYLDFPAPGIVVGTFGKKVHDRFKTVTFSRGIDIQAPEGSPVRAVFDGTVQIIQDFVGYGRVVILDHGNRYHTLYAHVERPEINKGDRVRRGQVIGTVGRSATSDDAVLHFEIRHQGTAIDPIGWLFRK